MNSYNTNKRWMRTVYSESRKHRYLLCSGVAVVGWLAASLGSNTVGLRIVKNRLRRFIQMKEVAPDTQSLINEVIADLNASRKYPIIPKRLEIVQTDSLFPQLAHKGNGRTFTGAFIVLPAGYEVKNSKEFLSKFSGGNFLEWKRIAEIGSLSQNAKKFALARELLYVHDNSFYHRCLLGLTALFVYTVYIYVTNTRLINRGLAFITSSPNTVSFKKRSYDARVKILVKYFPRANCILFGLLSVNCYWAKLYSHEHKLERKVDQTIAALGTDYIMGGLEFYDKLLQSNKYKREIFHENFSITGNTMSGILHTKTTPVTHRRDYFHGCLRLKVS